MPFIKSKNNGTLQLDLSDKVNWGFWTRRKEFLCETAVLRHSGILKSIL
ncbi:hypothetical protein [Leptospira borgpetersenii]|nr:hypothetical protein [Leptospira borgpetersenii]MBE8177932.1 hypothetical protein [Leptospira borgpetersenii serovar Ballum]